MLFTPEVQSGQEWRWYECFTQWYELAMPGVLVWSLVPSSQQLGEASCKRVLFLLCSCLPNYLSHNILHKLRRAQKLAIKIYCQLGGCAQAGKSQKHQCSRSCINPKESQQFISTKIVQGSWSSQLFTGSSLVVPFLQKWLLNSPRCSLTQTYLCFQRKAVGSLLTLLTK